MKVHKTLHVELHHHRLSQKLIDINQVVDFGLP